MVKDVANRFLADKHALVESGEMVRRTWDGYRVVVDLLVKEFGKHRAAADLGSDDFTALRSAMAKRGSCGKSRFRRPRGAI
jgi:hypothetical protein